MELTTALFSLSAAQIVAIATTFFCAFVVAFGLCSQDSDAEPTRDAEEEDVENEVDQDDEFDEDDPFDFKVSRDALEEYQTYLNESKERLAALDKKLKDATENGDARKELLEEKISIQLGLAAHAQESGAETEAFDNYEKAFADYDAYLASGGDLQNLLKKVAAGRLSYAVALYENGDNENADKEYVRARKENEELAQLGDREARVDMLGIDLNRASILFADGDRKSSFELLDETIAELKKLVEDPDYLRYEVPPCLAKAYLSKGWSLRSTLDEDDDLERPEAVEASEAYENAIKVYRTLVEDGGETQYRRELADALVESLSVKPQHSQEDLEDAAFRLKEAGDAYQKCVILGENDACVDFFEVSLERAKILMKLERNEGAFKLYDSIIDAFDNLEDSDELPILEGLAVAYQNRAKLRNAKEREDFKKNFDDLSKAIELQVKIANDLVATLAEDEGGCCGGHGHEHDHEGGCCGGHGHGHDHEGCCCGGHGHEHDHEGCCCGREHGVGSAERQFFIKHWVADNYAALMECLFERARVRLELNDRDGALGDCMLAEDISDQYRSVLREGEELDDEPLEQIRSLKRAF